MSSNNGYAKIPGGRADENEAEGIEQRYIGGAASVEPTQGAGEQAPGTVSQTGIAIQKWNITEVDHAMTSPVDVSGGSPAFFGGIICTETLAGSEFDLYDGTTKKNDINVANQHDEAMMNLAGAIFGTSLRVVIPAAGTAGKILVKWWPKA